MRSVMIGDMTVSCDAEERDKSDIRQVAKRLGYGRHGKARL